MSAVAGAAAAEGAAQKAKPCILDEGKRRYHYDEGPNVKTKTLKPIIKDEVQPGSTVHTDELRSYNGLSKA